MARAERELTGVWEQNPQWASGDRGQSPLELMALLYLDAHLLRFSCDILRCC